MKTVSLRPGRPTDAEGIANVIYDAFNFIATRFGQVSDFTSPPVERTRVRLKLLDQFNDNCVVAEFEKKVVGVNFINCQGDIGAVGPLAVLPSFHGQKIGRRLMESVIEHGNNFGFKSQRLLQAAYNSESMGLYLRMGLVIREQLVNLNGSVSGNCKGNPDVRIERGAQSDVQNCSQFCEKLYSTGRSREINNAALEGDLFIASENGNIVGLTTGIGFSGFSMALTNDVIKGLIINQATIEPPGILVPATNHSLVKWCIDSGLKINQSMNLMTLGEYQEPVGSWMPSINF